MDAAWLVEGARVEAGAEGIAIESFDVFFVREYPHIVAVGLALTGSLPVAEDIAQEALMRASRRWDRIGKYDKPGAWVRRVAMNLATSTLRRRLVERRALARLAGQRAPEPSATTAASDEFWRLVRALPARQRQAATLYYLEDRSVADIAGALGCAEGTAKAHLHKARTALARMLHEEEPR